MRSQAARSGQDAPVFFGEGSCCIARRTRAIAPMLACAQLLDTGECITESCGALRHALMLACGPHAVRVWLWPGWPAAARKTHVMVVRGDAKSHYTPVGVEDGCQGVQGHLHRPLL